MPNLLHNETSPYLLQHADNPVDWMPYGEKAFITAQQLRKPVLVSIGYSSCHWCHVMAHESFENKEIAAIMNENFVCIKVDREERPDVDQTYMDSVQLLHGSGGWPLNCFTLPNGKPFWGGTYFKPNDWTSILLQIAEAYKNQEQEIKNQAAYLTSQLKAANTRQPKKQDTPFLEKDIPDLFGLFLNNFDSQNGGFGSQPKFPMPIILEFLFQYHCFTKDETAKNHALFSLKQMAMGGIFDQVGGGFSRYSVDAKWHIPHFEKMLYDNAQLISLFANAYKISNDPFFKNILYRTLNFIEREFTSPQGLFYSALDADSQGEEGSFYVWKKLEFDHVLGDYSDLLNEYYGMDKQAAFEDGKNVLCRQHTDALFAQQHFLSENELRALVIHANSLLLESRNKRTRPLTDDKIITSWNALMISAYVDAYTALGETCLLDKAILAAEFFMDRIKINDFRHIYKDNSSQHFVFLDDCAFCCDAFLKLYSVTGNEMYLQETLHLIDFCLENFYDEASALFWFTPKKQDILVRKQEILDQVIPASNSVMAQVLWETGILTENITYQNLAQQMLQSVSPDLQTNPFYHANWLMLAINQLQTPTVVAVCGENASSILEKLHRSYLPHCLIIGSNKASKLPYFENRWGENQTFIYICREKGCLPPIETAEEAIQTLKNEC